jgi:hypothetical protein
MAQTQPDPSTDDADGAGAGAGTATAAAGAAFTTMPPFRRPWRERYGVTTVLAILLTLTVAAAGLATFAAWKAVQAKDDTLIAITRTAVENHGWQTVGKYKVDKGRVQGKVAFGDNCRLDVTAPDNNPSTVTLHIWVMTDDGLLVNKGRWHRFLLSGITFDSMMASRAAYNLDDCRVV